MRHPSLSRLCVVALSIAHIVGTYGHGILAARTADCCLILINHRVDDCKHENWVHIHICEYNVVVVSPLGLRLNSARSHLFVSFLTRGAQSHAWVASTIRYQLSTSSQFSILSHAISVVVYNNGITTTRLLWCCCWSSSRPSVILVSYGC
jgi:hypothetical protein